MATFPLLEIHHVEKWNNPLHLTPFFGAALPSHTGALRCRFLYGASLRPLVIKRDCVRSCQRVRQTLTADEEPAEEEEAIRAARAAALALRQRPQQGESLPTL